jgi:hypothetical protein
MVTTMDCRHEGAVRGFRGLCLSLSSSCIKEEEETVYTDMPSYVREGECASARARANASMCLSWDVGTCSNTDECTVTETYMRIG